MARKTCIECGRPLKKSNSPNGENPCLICDPQRKRPQKQVQGVAPTVVSRETPPEPKAEEPKPKKKPAKKKAAKKVAKKTTKKKAAKKK